MKNFLFSLILLASMASAAEPDLSLFGKQLDGAQQVIVVTPGTGIQSKVSAYEYRPGEKRWVRVLGPFDSVLGRKGFAMPGEKREGDGKTPSGIYALGDAFGYAEKMDTGLHYRQSGSDDFWVDDVESPNYNQWVHGDPHAKSFEKMHRDDGLYSAGIIVEYNTAPISKGAGSAIFLHVWRSGIKPTAGCVAMEEKNILALLHWLDASQKPRIILNPEALK
jgi:L,D-peptidoglycan transpeptidase YkuD (ErfK/YbiS/YcfS/YnhG family)